MKKDKNIHKWVWNQRLTVPANQEFIGLEMYRLRNNCTKMNIQIFIDKKGLISVPDDCQSCRSRGLLYCLHAIAISVT